MKRLTFISLVAILAVSMVSCGGSTEKKQAETTKVEVAETAKVLVYYFHSKQRCKTCLAVQDVAGKTIADNFAENSNVKFFELDFTEAENSAIAEKFEVAGSALMIVSGEDHINLTPLAFANAIKNPDVLKEAMVTEINNYLNK
jgi:hypothetical protein